MVKLKTLNEIECNDADHPIYCGNKKEGGHTYTEQELKREILKWYHRSDADKHRFIREFFNLTEKEILEASNNGL